MDFRKLIFSGLKTDKEQLKISSPNWPSGKDGLFVKKLTGSEMEQYVHLLTDDDEATPANSEGNGKPKRISNYRRMAYWIVICIIDKDGGNVFNLDENNTIKNEKNPLERDVDLLMKRPIQELRDVSDQVFIINGIADTSEEDAKKN